MSRALVFKSASPTLLKPNALLPTTPAYTPAGTFRFSSKKGVNYVAGIDSAGVSDWQDWLSTAYDESTYDAQVSHMVNTWGARTIRIFLWLDRMLTKDANWGTRSFNPRTCWDRTYKANWESFLTNVIIPKGAQLIPTLFIIGDDTTCNFEVASLLPDTTSPRLIDVNLNNGGQESPGSPTWTLPTNWAITLGTGGTAVYQANTGGAAPLAGPNEAQLTRGTTNLEFETPHVAYNKGRTRIDLDVRGGLAAHTCTPLINYYDASGNLLLQYLCTIKTPGTSWTTLSYVTRTERLPGNVASVSLTIRLTTQGHIIYVGAVRMHYGSKSIKHQNYIDAIREWARMYSPLTSYGRAIAAWEVVNEQYDNGNAEVDGFHPFLVDAYKAIREVSTTPILVSMATKKRYDTAGNEWLYEDCGDGISDHVYDDEGDLSATLATWNMKKILGEAGSSTNTTGTKQVETLTITNGDVVATTGTAILTLTAAICPSSPITVNVSLVALDSATTIATKCRTALAANTEINTYFKVAGTGRAVRLDRRIATEANDATLNLAIDANGTGITSIATSTNTTAGVQGSYATNNTALQAMIPAAARNGCKLVAPYALNGRLASTTFIPDITDSPAAEWYTTWAP